MSDQIDWSVATYEGNRRRQHEEFHALTFREKLMVIEQLELVAKRFSPRPSSGDSSRQERGRADS